jgi:hypothetical protein
LLPAHPNTTSPSREVGRQSTHTLRSIPSGLPQFSYEQEPHP